MYEGRKHRRERGSDEHHGLNKHDEHGKDGDNDIESSDTGAIAISLLNLHRAIMDLQLVPRGRGSYWSMVCIGVEDLDGVTIPAMVCALLPELSPIQIRICDTE